MSSDENLMPVHGDDGFDPDGWMVLPGVNYVTGWRAAENAAVRLRAALAGLGLGEPEVAVRAATRADGSPVLLICASIPTACHLAELLDEASREVAEAERRARSPGGPTA